MFPSDTLIQGSSCFHAFAINSSVNYISSFQRLPTDCLERICMSEGKAGFNRCCKTAARIHFRSNQNQLRHNMLVSCVLGLSWGTNMFQSWLCVSPNRGISAHCPTFTKHLILIHPLWYFTHPRKHPHHRGLPNQRINTTSRYNR